MRESLVEAKYSARLVIVSVKIFVERQSAGKTIYESQVTTTMNQTTSNQWLKKVPQEVGWYLAGFVDGEGSFNVSLKKVSDYQLKWKVEPSFNVSQRDISNLILLKKSLGTGRLRKRKDGVAYFEVRNYKMLYERVIPFFEKFSFRSRLKVRNFSIFKKIVKLMARGEHLTEEGFKKNSPSS